MNNWSEGNAGESTTRSFGNVSRNSLAFYNTQNRPKKGNLIFDANFESDEVYEFAYCYPYTYARLQAYLDNIERTGYPYLKRETLCNTLQRRRLDLITISTPSPDILKKSVIVVTARVHPGETPSSYVCQGFIDFMVSDHPIAVKLREHLVFKIIPMLNPDGVYLGNYRCSLMGFDLNRQWQCPSQWAHPTIFAVKQMLMKFNQDLFVDVDFFIDIHAHSTLMNGFMYGNVFEDEGRAERQAVFPTLLNRMADDFSLTQTNYNRDTVKAGTGRRTLGGILDDRTLCYTLEVSFFSYTDGKTGKLVPYTEEKYACLGRNLARTFHEYYVAKGVFPTGPALVGDLPTMTPFAPDHEFLSISTTRLAQQMAGLSVASSTKSEDTGPILRGDGPNTSRGFEHSLVLPWLPEASGDGDREKRASVDCNGLQSSKDLLEQLVRFNNPVGATLISSRTETILKSTQRFLASDRTSK